MNWCNKPLYKTSYYNTLFILQKKHYTFYPWRQVFAAAGPKLWNSLPAELRQANISFQRFNRLLDILFGCWECSALWLLMLFSYLLAYKYIFSCVYIFSSGASTDLLYYRLVPSVWHILQIPVPTLIFLVHGLVWFKSRGMLAEQWWNL